MRIAYGHKKRIKENFGQEVLSLLEGARSPEGYQSVENWCRQCYNEPSKQEKIECAVNELLNGFGTEAIFGNGVYWPDITYVNMGDTYALTIVWDHAAGKIYATDWGTIIEQKGY